MAPEHCAPNTLKYMGKPPVEVFNKFSKRFYELTKKAGKKQYLVPYLMSSHPGSTLEDAVDLAEDPQQQQHSPGAGTGLLPHTGHRVHLRSKHPAGSHTLKPVFVEKSPEGKALQRALLQYYEPRNAEKVVKALHKTHREDLIPLLVPGYKPKVSAQARPVTGRKSAQNAKNTARPVQGRFVPNHGKSGGKNSGRPTFAPKTRRK